MTPADRLPLDREYQVVAEILAAQALAEIEREAFAARKRINHQFGALIAWNRKRFERARQG